MHLKTIATVGGVVVSVALSAGALAITLGGERAVAFDRLRSLDEARADHEKRLRELEADRATIAAMVERLNAVDERTKLTLQELIAIRRVMESR